MQVVGPEEEEVPTEAIVVDEAVLVVAGEVEAATVEAVRVAEGREVVAVSAALPQARRVDGSAEAALVVGLEVGRAKLAKRDTVAVGTKESAEVELWLDLALQGESKSRQLKDLQFTREVRAVAFGCCRWPHIATYRC